MRKTEKAKLLHRVRPVRGQMEAVERAIEDVTMRKLTTFVNLNDHVPKGGNCLRSVDDDGI
jgi:hypothetical protein